MKLRIGGIFIISFFCFGCSSLNNKTVVTGVVSFLSCSAIGAATAPEDEKPEMHGLMWGTACSSLGMIASELIQDNSNNKRSNNKLLQLRNDDSIEELRIKNSLLDSDAYESLDIETKNKLNGPWSIYKIDNWVLDGEKLKHENMEIEFKK